MEKKWLVGNRNEIDSVENIIVDVRMIQLIIETFAAVMKWYSTSLDGLELRVSVKNTEN